jgi:ankyrin repeat protein
MDNRYVLSNRRLCEWFLSHGADPNATCKYDWTPLSKAVGKAQREIIELLFEHGGSIANGQLLHFAVHRNQPDCLDILQLLLDKGCDINAIRYQNHKFSYDHDNFLMGLGTPLHEAAMTGRVHVAKFLLDRGANPRARDTWGRLPIDRAHEHGHLETIDLLGPY